ncbi:MAG: phosphate regulon sensor histidine kinase PhoR [Burkholderiales bacterium]|nr:phosphate regulon sensor histidine kinase PhoR [Burkholderiales bacterium]MDE1926475.1 phosphate regulon sensor histidine kinase PhoR [Burkholderiales bacterium]MDE2160222.1 phosphate regulon sensor histidine kinase PhoR [Burkholderiales bacterium]MDE2503235.1 phosphate regulon sensor histidine kinase PhoR [Burkholderiales bacterium]
MGWWFARTLAALMLVVIGSLVGLLVGAIAGQAVTGILAGGICVVAVLVIRDSWRGQSLMGWLRGPQDEPAPRDTGFWGELAYRTEKAMRTREAQAGQERDRLAHFLSAIEASPNGVLMLDADDQIDWCNSVAAQHFGLDPQRDKRQRVTNLVRTPAFVAHLQAANFDEPVTFAGPLGRTTLSVLVRPYGEGMKLVLTQDITERERTEAMRRDFVANVSHEIRTPLTVLAGFVETLSTLRLSEPERQRVLVLMAQQTDRMQALVGDLLTLAKLEGSPNPPADTWLPMAALMRRACGDAITLSAGRHQVEASGGEDAEFAGSEPELYSAAANLLHNAVRYTPEGGRIQMRWQWRAEGGAELLVIDSGIGIAREHLPRLTERFYRVDGSRSRDTGGTGLGLAIVKHVAQRHGGEIVIQSEPGKGSTFKLQFPAWRVRRREVADKPVAA